MSYTASITITANIGGMTQMSGVATRTADGLLPRQVTLPAGKAGTLSTRTSASVGVATLGVSHGITTGMVVDVHWTGGCRYGVTVGTVDGVTVPLTDSGAGDDYPVEDTALVVAEQVEVAAVFDGDDAEVLYAACDQTAHIDIQESDDTSIDARLLTANEPWVWVSGMGANPLTGDATAKVMATNGTTTAATLNFVALHDATP